ncbi:MAG: NAD(P)-binding domain-containing protein, partial [Acidimicrobiales bacterium]
MDVGILGGTGPAGRALAARLAMGGLAVVLGSRQAERAEQVAAELCSRWPRRSLQVRGAGNAGAAAAGLVVVATPWDA